MRTSPRAVLALAVTLLSINFALVAAALGCAAGMAAMRGGALAALRRSALAVLAALVAFSVRQRALRVDAADSQQVYDFYMTLWRDFYGAYACLPFAR